MQSNHKDQSTNLHAVTYETLTIDQTDETIVFSTENQVPFDALTLMDALTEQALSFPKEPQDQSALFIVPKKELTSFIKQTDRPVTLTGFWETVQPAADEQEDLEESETKEEAPVQRRLPFRLDEFKEVTLANVNPFFADSASFQITFDSDSSLKLIGNHTVSRAPYLLEHRVTGIDTTDQDLVITGSLTTRFFSLSKLEASLETEEEDAVFLRTAAFQPASSASDPHTYTYDYTVQVGCTDIAQHLFTRQSGDSFLFPYLLIHLSGLDAPLTAGMDFMEGSSKQSLPELIQPFGRMGYVFSFRPTEFGRLQLCAVLYDKDTLTYARERSATIWMTRPFHSNKDIWLIASNTPYERSFNSWDFFCYVREQAPEKEVYYVLDPASPYWAEALETAGDHLLAYKSQAYIWKLLTASLLITGGPAFHLYPFGTASWEPYVRAKKVLLPDRMLGMSKERWTVNQRTAPSAIDKVLVSSKTEKRFAAGSLGFEESAIELTGLPHHSPLLEKSKRRPEQKQLLVLPKDKKPQWLSQTEAHQNPFLSLAKNPAFKKWAEAEKVVPVIVLPSYDLEEAAAFQAEGWRVIADTEELFDHFLDSTLLLTDYHSSSLDFALLERPVFFYRPYFTDQVQSMEEMESPIYAYANELPGEIAEREDEVVYLLEQAAQASFEMSRKNRKKADALLEHRDHQANERILQAIRSLK